MTRGTNTDKRRRKVLALAMKTGCTVLGDSAASDVEQARPEGFEEHVGASGVPSPGLEASSSARAPSSGQNMSGPGPGSNDGDSSHRQLHSPRVSDADETYDGTSFDVDFGGQDDGGDGDDDDRAGVDSERSGDDENMSVLPGRGDDAAMGDNVCVGAAADDQQRELMRQRRARMSVTFGSAHPPLLYRAGDNPVHMAVWGVPGFVPASESNRGSGRATSRLNLHDWSTPGVAVVRESDDSARAVWFCNCTAENVQKYRFIEALHSMAGGCSDLESACCSCVLYCAGVLDDGGLSVEDTIRNAPTYHGTSELEGNVCVRDVPPLAFS